MEKDLINSNEVANEEISLTNIEWDDYSSEDYCDLKCAYFNKCFGNRVRCVKKAFDDIFKTLTKKEEIVLKLRLGFYGNKRFTLEGIAKVLSVTRQRVWQIEGKALRKLRHPFRMKRMIGCSTIEALNSSEFCEKLVDGILAKKENVDTSAAKIEICETTSIENLGLSFRAYNCLKRAQFSTVSDLLSKNVIDILKVRNLGNKSATEVLCKLDEFGFRLADCPKDKYSDVKVRVGECWNIILKEWEKA